MPSKNLLSGRMAELINMEGSGRSWIELSCLEMIQHIEEFQNDRREGKAISFSESFMLLAQESRGATETD